MRLPDLRLTSSGFAHCSALPPLKFTERIGGFGTFKADWCGIDVRDYPLFRGRAGKSGLKQILNRREALNDHEAALDALERRISSCAGRKSHSAHTLRFCSVCPGFCSGQRRRPHSRCVILLEHPLNSATDIRIEGPNGLSQSSGPILHESSSGSDGI